jgi:hypothetical protein
MVKPESQTRQSNTRSHSSNRRLTPDTEAHTNGTFSSLESTVIEPVVEAVVEHQSTQKTPSPEEIENAFLNYYSNFVGSDLDEKTTWKSENFSQNHKPSRADREIILDPKIRKAQTLRQLKPSPINPEEFH